MPTLLLALLALHLLLGGCDPFAVPDDAPLEEGQQLEVVEYAADQPSSRAAYAGLGTFIAPGRVVIFDPGTGPDDPPRIIRSIHIPDRLTSDAQIDRDGFLWVATPDRESAPLREAYVLDPHAGTVHRALTLPEEVRAAAAVLVGPEYVYLRSLRNGFSGGIGVVDRRCAVDASRCEVRLFTELGGVSVSAEHAFHLTEDALFSFSTRGDEGDHQPALHQIDPQTGEILRTFPYAGASFAFDDTALYTVGFHQPDINSVTKLDEETLDVEAEAEIGRPWIWPAVKGDRLYLAGTGEAPGVEVRSAETLAVIDTLDVSAAGAVTAVFGFVAPGVLMLNHTAYLDTTTGEVVPNAFPIEASFSFALRLPEGHPLAY